MRDLKASSTLTLSSACLMLLTCLQLGCSPAKPVPSASCINFDETIDRNILNAAMSRIDGDMNDKSAMQQGARLAENNNRLSVIAINIQLMTQHNCVNRETPIDPAIYEAQAYKCMSNRQELVLAELRKDESTKKVAKEAVALSCNFKSWNLPKS